MAGYSAEITDSGLLDVGDGQRIWWDASGAPDGKPVLTVHGGPGGGGTQFGRRGFDPAKFRVVSFDQRGCGRSTPNVADPSVGLDRHTTDRLISDMERLRVRLGIEKWLLYGGSWGTTLTLAYAQRHPSRVSGLVLLSTFTSTADEVEWLYGGLRRLLPAQWAEFRAVGDLAGYSRLLASPDRNVQLRAARAWCAWEDAVVAHESGGGHSDLPDDDLIAFARLCAHYYRHHAWLDDDQLLRGLDRLAGIPAVLIHGALDWGAPLAKAWQLAQAWPEAELIVIEDAGHLGNAAFGKAVLETIARFEDR
ncbi:prolyl aminopeptidase [Amycolatopsis benzoatilytica]|uniref:prolyl aminopeptidase n=1 Tax=Amycolatopsis benzoatilytica TaxID=346045 RepID=UPI000369F5F1|nr:prolyl aminopeptidase [Amycolatopsis benzoatilytica]